MLYPPFLSSHPSCPHLLPTHPLSPIFHLPNLNPSILYLPTVSFLSFIHTSFIYHFHLPILHIPSLHPSILYPHLSSSQPSCAYPSSTNPLSPNPSSPQPLPTIIYLLFFTVSSFISPAFIHPSFILHLLYFQPSSPQTSCPYSHFPPRTIATFTDSCPWMEMVLRKHASLFRFQLIVHSTCFCASNMTPLLLQASPFLGSWVLDALQRPLLEALALSLLYKYPFLEYINHCHSELYWSLSPGLNQGPAHITLWVYLF